MKQITIAGRVTKDADNRLIDLENLRDEDLEELRATFERVARSRGVSIEDLILRRDDQT